MADVTRKTLMLTASMSNIHPTAIVDPRADVSDGVTIGPYAIITGPVEIGAGTIIHAHTHVQGQTVIGEQCAIGPAAYVGLPPQHLKADPEIGSLRIGDRVIIRETATIHRSTSAGDEHATRIGNDCFLMGSVHIGHDCVLADGVIAANAVLLGGHCTIGEKTFLGGGCTLHQFVSIGRLAMIGGNEVVTHDVPPFAAVRYGYMKGYNAIGCKRSGIEATTLRAIRGAFYILKHQRNRQVVLEWLERDYGQVPEVCEIVEFIKRSKRGILPSSVRRWRDGSDEF